ncbi:MAG: NAD-dependent epimerase/dehydratase family protein [Polyangiales bacterium]
MRVLVLGATGFVGQRVCRVLAEDGAQIVAGVRPSSDTDPIREKVDEIRVISLNDPNTIAAAMRGCDAVVHAAGTNDPSTPRSVAGEIDLAGTENVILACASKDNTKLVFISRADVTLGRGERIAASETFPVHKPPSNAWLDIKRITDDVASVYTNGIVLRPAFLWGAGDDRTMNRLRSEAEHGGIRMVGDGRNLMSTTYIGNLAHAVVCALKTDRATTGAYQICDREITSANTFTRELSEAMGWPAPKKNAHPFLDKITSFIGVNRLHPIDFLRVTQTAALDDSAARKNLAYEPRYDRADALIEMRDELATRSQEQAR